MSKRHFVPVRVRDQQAWYGNLATKLPAIAPLVGVSQSEVDAVTADHECLKHAMALCEAYKTKARECVQYAEQVRSGGGNNPIPAPVELPPPPPLVSAGVFRRITDLAVRIKRHPGYTLSLGKDLGLVGPETTVDVQDLKPSLSVRLRTGTPVLSWEKGDAEALEIHADRGTGTFALATICTRTRYIDKSALPPPGTAAVWKYKAAYRIKDEPIGHWSNPVSIAVTG